MSTRIRSYRELRRIDSFEERYEYLRLDGTVGRETFGYDRYLNQRFYTSREWRMARQEIIARDLGCDLGVEGYEIFEKIIIHHMNPITVEQVMHGDDSIFDPEFLICVTHNTHNAIHYGDNSLLKLNRIVERRPGDTKLW